MISLNEIYLDTHAVIWLENGELHKFKARSLDYLANCPLKISPMVKLELQYLYERNRLTEPADKIIQKIMNKADFQICQKNWHDIVNIAVNCTFTRDAFDRLIVAHAMLDNSILISKDENLTKTLCELCLVGFSGSLKRKSRISLSDLIKTIYAPTSL